LQYSIPYFYLVFVYFFSSCIMIEHFIGTKITYKALVEHFENILAQTEIKSV
jgi:hypothetical protein